MFPRNLTFFRFPATINFGHDSDFGLGLRECALKPVGPLELASTGFVSPFGRPEPGEAPDLAHVVGNTLRLTIGTEEKILPAAAINDLLGKKVAEVEAAEGRKLGGKARKRLKDDILHELLPKALVKSRRTDAYLFEDLGLLAVDTSSRKQAEAVASEIRRALGSFPALPVNAEVAPRSVLTGWVAGEPLPEGGYDGDQPTGGALALGEDCTLADAADGGALVRCQHQDLHSDEIAKHLEAGKQVTRLGLSLDDHLSFVLGEDLVVRRLKFLDGAVDQLADTERDDLRAELDARLVLVDFEVRGLFGVLERAFRISAVE